MKNGWKRCALLFTGAVLLGVVATGFEANAANPVDVTINAKITSTLDESATRDLNFGDIDPNPAGDVITVNALAGNTTTATAASGSSITQTAVTSGQITVKSASAMTIQLDFGGDTTTISDAGAVNSMEVNNFAANSEGAVGAEVSHAAGIDSVINVGGDLIIPAAAVNGTYTGTMSVTLVYL